jgi:protein-S-isoprenylcysteine O-methyltransferase Ste14
MVDRNTNSYRTYFIVGIPLRMVSYATLGKNFTFALAEPDSLITTGIYRYLQHPSYTGIFLLVICNTLLLARTDGVLSCWIPISWYRAFRIVGWIITPLFLKLFVYGIWVRVEQEERMLRDKFKIEWEEWHTRTWRVVPGII